MKFLYRTDCNATITFVHLGLLNSYIKTPLQKLLVIRIVNDKS